MTAPTKRAQALPQRPPPVASQRGMGLGTLITFFALTFGLCWGALALLIFFEDQMEAIFGEVSATNLVFIFGVYAPGIAGVFLVWRHYGIKGLLSFFKRITLWRMSLAWWVFLLIGIPAIVYLGAALSGTITDPFPFSPWYGVLSALIFALLLGPMGEEFGWRGVALPLLQRRLAPLWASLILGVIWGLWHLPAFILSGTPQSSMSLIPFFIGVLALAVILTPMFNAARGSILIAMLYHLQVMNPAFPDAQPWDTLVWVIAAVVVVVVNRKAMLSRKGTVTEVLMPGEEEGGPNDARIAAAGTIKGKVLPSSRKLRRNS